MSIDTVLLMAFFLGTILLVMLSSEGIPAAADPSIAGRKRSSTRGQRPDCSRSSCLLLLELLPIVLMAPKDLARDEVNKIRSAWLVRLQHRNRPSTENGLQHRWKRSRRDPGPSIAYDLLRSRFELMMPWADSSAKSARPECSSRTAFLHS